MIGKDKTKTGTETIFIDSYRSAIVVLYLCREYLDLLPQATRIISLKEAIIVRLFLSQMTIICSISNGCSNTAENIN